MTGDGTDGKFLKENLAGKTIEFKYGGSSYSITLSASDTVNYKAANGKSAEENIAKAINDLLAKQTTNDGKKLSDIVKATGKDGEISFEDVGSGGNALELTGGSALHLLGLADEKGEKIVNDGKFHKTDDDGNSVNQVLTGTVSSKITTEQDFYEYIGGQSLTFSYNGTSGTVTLPGAQNLKDRAAAFKTADPALTDEQAATKAVAQALEEKLSSTFGKGRIKVTGNDDGTLSFQTTLPGDTPTEDKSSSLTLTGGSMALIGTNKGVLGLHAGQTTRTETGAKLDSATLAALQSESITVKDKDGNDVTKKGFRLNGEFVEVKDNATTNDIVNAINNSKANVTVTYQQASDKFTFVSNDNGASGVINFSGNSDAALNALEKTFGLDLVNDDGTAKNELSQRGQDAVVAVRYAGSDEIVELTRDSNTFTVDGLTIGIKGTFGYDKDGELLKNEAGEIDEDNAVEISASVDTDKVMDTIKSFVEEYNAIVDLVNSELTTKHEKDYTPLSSEQKSELSDDEVEKWEAKAKAGLLYGDSDLRSLSMDLRTVATSYVAQLEKIGISVSSSYSDNGKLSVDETKLRSALETDPESVEKLFTATAGVDENGRQIYNGVATNLKSVMEKYVKTTGAMEDKGVLIRKAGSKSSAISMTENGYYKQLQEIEKLISSLNDRLKTERDRYVKQFSTLETLIANMNSQSSYLSSMSGY